MRPHQASRRARGELRRSSCKAVQRRTLYARHSVTSEGHPLLVVRRHSVDPSRFYFEESYSGVAAQSTATDQRDRSGTPGRKPDTGITPDARQGSSLGRKELAPALRADVSLHDLAGAASR